MTQTLPLVVKKPVEIARPQKDKRSKQIVESSVAKIAFEHNRRIVQEYLKEKRLVPVKESSLAAYIKPLGSFCAYLDKKKLDDPAQVRKEEVVGFLAGLKRQESFESTRYGVVHTFKAKSGDLSPTWVNFHKMVLKNFFRWLRQTPAPMFPPEVAWLKVKNPSLDVLGAEKYIPPEEFQKILSQASHPRDRALFHLLYVSGFRISEALALNVESVRFEASGAIVTLPADASSLKTGQRVVKNYPDDGSVKSLQDWYEGHAFKDNKKAPLFYSVSDRNRFGRLTRNGAYQKFIRLQILAGVTDTWTEHDLRHSAATNDGKRGMPPQMMEKKYGWKPGSRMVARYTHLAPEDYIKHEDISRGYRKPDEGGFIGLKSRKCPRCQEHNLPNQVYCGKCREPLSDSAREQVQHEQNEMLAQVVRQEMERLLSRAG